MTRAFLDLGQRGLKVRSRALTNTLYARLFLCDLFIHGIGGGKYDEVTDDMIRRYYGIEPPEYLVLSATSLAAAALSRPAGRLPPTPPGRRRSVLQPAAPPAGRSPVAFRIGNLVTFRDATSADAALTSAGPARAFRQLRAVSDELRGALAGKWRRGNGDWPSATPRCGRMPF